MMENLIRKKLKTSIVPQIVLANKLKKQKFYLINKIYTYLNTVTIILIGGGFISKEFFGSITNFQTSIL